MSKVKLIYIAGPFRAPTQWEIVENIRAAERVGFAVAQAGAMPVIPHANTAHFHGTKSDGFWLDGTLELMRRCDGVVMVPGWERSEGAKGEREEAKRLGLPIIGLGSGMGTPDEHAKFFRHWLDKLGWL